jgi:hypothetical protein
MGGEKWGSDEGLFSILGGSGKGTKILNRVK